LLPKTPKPLNQFQKINFLSFTILTTRCTTAGSFFINSSMTT